MVSVIVWDGCDTRPSTEGLFQRRLILDTGELHGIVQKQWSTPTPTDPLLAAEAVHTVAGHPSSVAT